MAVNFQQKRRTAATWTSENPVLLAGQIGLETDTRFWKFGDGTTAWTSLSYVSSTGAYTQTIGITAAAAAVQGDGALTAQINEISTAASGSGVTLPTALAGDTCIIVNNGANAIKVFPASSDNLGAGVDTVMSINLAAGDVATFYAYDATNWAGTVATRET